MGVDGPEAVAPALFELATQLEAPTSLADLGFELEAIDAVAKTVTAAPVSNPRAFTEEDVRYLVQQAYLGSRPLRSIAPFDKLRAQRRRLIIMTQVSPHGLHHVTAIATDPQSNVDFYTRALGLRLVKQTVNFDAPDTYHLYYGDEKGSPSSLLTFFPWPGVPQGRQGAGMTTATAFSVPGSSLGWWHERFKTLGIDSDAPRNRDEEEVLTFRDPDGMVIDLVASVGDHRSGWDGVADIPAEHAVRGLHAITLSERQLDPSATMLTQLLGMSLAGEEGERSRFGMAGGSSGTLVDVFAGVRDRAGRPAARSITSPSAHRTWRPRRSGSKSSERMGCR